MGGWLCVCRGQKDQKRRNDGGGDVITVKCLCCAGNNYRYVRPTMRSRGGTGGQADKQTSGTVQHAATALGTSNCTTEEGSSRQSGGSRSRQESGFVSVDRCAAEEKSWEEPTRVQCTQTHY